MKLVLGTQSINVNENLKLYNDLKNMFIDKGIIIAEKYLEEYSKYGNIDTALNKFDDFLQENYKELSECVCEILFKNGIYNVTAESFFSKYYDKYFNIYEQVSPIMDKLDEIADYANALDSQLESRKMSRGKWVGGGFGMSGAIKGAVGASALNAVGGAFHGIGDFFRGMSNDSKIGKLKKELYNDPHTNYLLSLSIYKGCSNFFFGLRDELINHKLLSPIKFNSSEATAMSKNAMKYCKNKEELQELLIKSVCMAPYAISLYKPLYSKFKDTKGLNEFAAFFGVDKELQFRNNLSIKKQLMIISEMPERDIEEQCEKLIEYIKLANEKNYDITDEMAKIVTLILKESASSASKLNNAIEIIKKKVPSNYKDDISRVISVFEKEKKDIIKNTEQKRVEELPSSNKEEIIAKIVKTMEVGNKYGIDESQSITSLLKKISQKYNSFSDLSDIENELEDLKCSKYPQIEIAIQSCEIRKKLRNFEIICDSIKPYMFSPQIIDMIKEARNGNPLHQQCLVEMFCKYDFLNSLRVSIKKGDENEKRISKNCGFVF